MTNSSRSSSLLNAVVVVGAVLLFTALRLLLPGPAPIDGSRFAAVAPKKEAGLALKLLQSDPGYAELELTRAKDESRATVLVEDAVRDPQLREPFAGSHTRLAEFPASETAPAEEETAVLVAGRFVVTLSGDDLSAEERTQWLASCQLDRLDRLDAPPLWHLVLVLVCAVALLLVFILQVRMQAFLALLLASLFVGLGAGMPLLGISQSMISGMGGSLGFLATVIGLGAIFGQIVESSGGAHTLAHSLLSAFGQKRAPWAMMMVGFVISIPVFFDVGLVILAPIIYALTRDAKKSLLYFGLPLIAGMGVTHAFIPPTPGPILVAENLGADLGAVIVAGFCIGLPTAIAATLVGRRLAERFDVPVPAEMETRLRERPEDEPKTLPTLGLVGMVMALPIVLILTGTLFKLLVDLGRLQPWAGVEVFRFLGEPVVALILATLLALYLLGTRHGFSNSQLLELSTKALGPAGIIILVTGAGGVFKQILVDSGVGVAIAETMGKAPVSSLVLAYLFAVIVRVTQGSATVAMIMASTLVAPLLAADLGMAEKALHVIAIAAGATTASHVNDSGFWMVSRYFGMTEKLTLKTWTVISTVISVVGFALTLLGSVIISG